MIKTAIVTGASAGIGEAAAVALSSKGFRVYAVARRAEKMAHLADQGIVPVSADVTDDASLVALVDRVVGETGRVDVLVNNAGYGSYGALEEVPMEEARRQFDVNVFGLARLTQLVLPHMRAQQAGRIINVSSVGGVIWEPLGAWYHATKFAVEGLSDSLRAELRPHGVDVVVIQPGAIKTEWAAISADNLRAASSEPAYAEQVRIGAAVLAKADTVKGASPPSTVAKTIVKAATARRPKSRYATGGGAKSVLFMKSLTTDRGWDRAITTAYKSQARG
ncbi:MAG: short-chain dehydrogenase/reductase [Frankiales bacterium]|nr:short-chain dehydrogenase/reductase [Frankiales bacterium]